MRRVREAKSRMLEALDLIRQALALDRAAEKGEIPKKAAAGPITRLVDRAIAESSTAVSRMRSYLTDTKRPTA